MKRRKSGKIHIPTYERIFSFAFFSIETQRLCKYWKAIDEKKGIIEFFRRSQKCFPNLVRVYEFNIIIAFISINSKLRLDVFAFPFSCFFLSMRNNEWQIWPKNNFKNPISELQTTNAFSLDDESFTYLPFISLYQNELFILSVISFMLNVQHRYQFCVFIRFFVLLFARLMKNPKSKKLFAWLNLFFVYLQMGKTTKSFQRKRKFIIRFDSVWWFMDEYCNIWQLLIFVKHVATDLVEMLAKYCEIILKNRF